MAEQEARSYRPSQARTIVEPNEEETVKSCKTYLAMKKLMLEHGAQAITVKCLGGIPIQTLGYPCLGFSTLLDEGVVGACEADMDSTLTMLMFLYAFGLPGFISDPLIDTSKNAVIGESPRRNQIGQITKRLRPSFSLVTLKFSNPVLMPASFM